MMYLGNRVRTLEYECGRADLVLVLPALLRKRIVHFAKNDDGEQRIIVVGPEGTAPRDTKFSAEPSGRERYRGTHTADRGTTMVAKCS